MKRLHMMLALAGLALVAQGSSCVRQPSSPSNHWPTLASLSVVPTSIGPGDSALVTCVAADADGDTLVYDWGTDMRLRIKGMPANYPSKVNAPNNSETFYPNYTPPGPDTVYVACTVRDRRGGSAGRAITFILHP